jgi:hypothetical protein
MGIVRCFFGGEIPTITNQEAVCGATPFQTYRVSAYSRPRSGAENRRERVRRRIEQAKIHPFTAQGFDAKTVNELHYLEGQNQALERKKSLGLLHIRERGPSSHRTELDLFFSSPCKTFNFPEITRVVCPINGDGTIISGEVLQWRTPGQICRFLC